MPATFTAITKHEMHEFLTALGFTQIDQSLPYMQGIKELVYGRILKKGICLRIYTGIDKYSGHSAACGADAIRLAVVKRESKYSEIRGIGKAKRVHRVENWRINLLNRITEVQERFL